MLQQLKISSVYKCGFSDSLEKAIQAKGSTDLKIFFFLTWLKCGVVMMTEKEENHCIMAASAWCYGGSDRLRSLAAFG